MKSVKQYIRNCNRLLALEDSLYSELFNSTDPDSSKHSGLALQTSERVILELEAFKAQSPKRFRTYINSTDIIF